MSKPIKSVEEFIKWTKKLNGQMLLYRGLGDADWEVESSAYRRIRASQDDQEDLLRVAFLDYITQHLDNASLQGFRYQNNRNVCDLELLAELQHYGAATCLIDFTENALIALWFACREEPQKDGKVVAMATDDPDKFSTVNYEVLKEPITYFLMKEKLWKWTPSGLNNRMVAQQSVFVFGEGKIEDNIYRYKNIRIEAGSKKDILETLIKTFGIKEQNLFNDLPGFALYNAHDKQYGDSTVQEYYYHGLTFQQQREYGKAKDYYNKALELDPHHALAYYNRGIAKNALKDYQGAISDSNKALELNPRYAGAYNNLGNSKRALGDHQGAILDYNKALELNPQYPGAHCNRGICKAILNQNQSAIRDFNKALRLNPDSAVAYINRGSVKNVLGDHQGAILDYNMALKIKPRFAPLSVYCRRGNAKHALGDDQGAISDYSKALEINPQYANAYFNRGHAKRALGDLVGAKEDWDRAREIDPNLEAPG